MEHHGTQRTLARCCQYHSPITTTTTARPVVEAAPPPPPSGSPVRGWGVGWSRCAAARRIQKNPWYGSGATCWARLIWMETDWVLEYDAMTQYDWLVVSCCTVCSWLFYSSSCSKGRRVTERSCDNPNRIWHTETSRFQTRPTRVLMSSCLRCSDAG